MEVYSKVWKKSRCPSVSEWTNQWQHIQIIEYYSTLKGSELSSHENICGKLKHILLHERSQFEKKTYYMLLPKLHSGKRKII
jgi:hypothetical protein